MLINFERRIILKNNEEKNLNENTNVIKIDEKFIQEYNNIDGDVDDYIFAWQNIKYVSER